MIHDFSKEKQLEIFKMCKSKDIFYTENKNGVFINLSELTLIQLKELHQYVLYINEQEEEIGYVTSGTQAPSLGHPIGLGYVPKEMAKIGNKLLIKAGRKNIEATIVKPPFYKV